MVLPDDVESLTVCIVMPTPLIGGALSDDAVWRLSVWRLSVAYIGHKSRTERPRKTKIGKEVAHVTCNSDTTFKVKRSRSPGRFTHRGVYTSGTCSGERGKVFTVGTYCYALPSAGAAVGSVARSASAPTEGGEGRGISPAYSLIRHNATTRRTERNATSMQVEGCERG